MTLHTAVKAGVAFLACVLLAGPVVADDSATLMRIDHYVRVKSTAPAMAGQEAQIYVREVVLAGTAARAAPGSSRVVLFMKGTPQFPQCGFSSRAAQILQACGVQEFAYCNVLEDGAIREGVKTYSSWPTIPQLYVDGNFVGGADIMQEMYASGELQSILTT